MICTSSVVTFRRNGAPTSVERKRKVEGEVGVGTWTEDVALPLPLPLVLVDGEKAGVPVGRGEWNVDCRGTELDLMTPRETKLRA